MHRHLLHNDNILDTHEKHLSAGQVGLMNGWGVFSTIRVADGVLFAFERHWERMHTDAGRMRVPFPSGPDWLQLRLLRLVEANKVRNGTLRVAIIRNRGGLYEGPDMDRDFDVIAFTTDLHHWGETVRLYIKPHGRHAQSEFAGAKITSWAQNLTWYEEAHQRGFDEVILLNERGEVSECTSANVFVLRGDQVLTPPLNSGCLPGITRQLLLEEIHVPGVKVVEQTLFPADFENSNQVFITSSTRDLLAVTEIESLKVKTEGIAVVDALVKAFGEYRAAYVKQAIARNLDKVTA